MSVALLAQISKSSSPPSVRHHFSKCACSQSAALLALASGQALPCQSCSLLQALAGRCAGGLAAFRPSPFPPVSFCARSPRSAVAIPPFSSSLVRVRFPLQVARSRLACRCSRSVSPLPLLCLAVLALGSLLPSLASPAGFGRRLSCLFSSRSRSVFFGGLPPQKHRAGRYPRRCSIVAYKSVRHKSRSRSTA